MPSLRQLISQPADIIPEATGLRTPGQAAEDISGITAARAQQEAQALQEQFGREAIDAQRLAQLRLEETLAPFVQFGMGFLPRFEGLMGGVDPVVTDLTRLADQAILGNAALNPAAADILARNQPLVAQSLMSRERGDLLAALGLGQASAAQQASGELQTGGARQDLLTQIGNVQAAGGIGQAQSLGQGSQNLVGLGTTLAGLFRNGRS